MQPVIIADQQRDLYAFLNCLLTAKQTILDNLQISPDITDSVVIWSPEAQSSLFDSFDKLELVQIYADKLDLKLTLSAASDLQLRQWGHQIGWQVLWDVPGLDNEVATKVSVGNSQEADAGLLIAC